MKSILFLLITIPILGFSQVPPYYSNVNLNLSGTALKNELANKVTSTHTNFLSYTPGVWNALKQTDVAPSNTSKVLLIYGYNDVDANTTNDRTRGINNNGGGTGDWNREHVYPKSLGNPNLGTSGPGADAHHLRPCDVQRNSSRGNRKFGDGSSNSGATSQGHWYPGDEWKGDVARIMMYMYIRYGNRCLPKNVGVGVTNTSDGNMLNLFLEWNEEDPVSSVELQRNPILENLQGNRNPFIDNPAFATQIWGGPQAEDRFGNIGGGDTQAPTIPGNITTSNTTQTSTFISWSASTDNVGVTGYEIYRNGGLLGTTATTSYTISGLTPDTTYSFFIRAKDAANNRSASSNTIQVTTQSSTTGGNASGLFFSEYIEGSSNNKALEIANHTGASISLSAYSIKRQTNGSGSWSSALNLTGTLANGQVFVVANNSASSTVKNKADLTSSAATMTFNGNDPVGLFKNGTLIDIIGVFNGGSSNFAKDVTLRRKSTVISPTVSYTSSEWDSFSQNTFDNLGNHTFAGGSSGGTDNTSLQYCLSKGNTVDFEYIDYVEIGNVSNTTVANEGYGDFTSQVGNLIIGTNTIKVSAGFASSSYPENWAVWIDFDQNGTFDSSERVVNSTSSSSNILMFNFNIPSTAKNGATRMRVAMKWNGVPTPCETFGYGEVEDYTVNINASLARSKNQLKGNNELQDKEYSIKIHPNPASGFIQISMETKDHTFDLNFILTDIHGNKVRSGKISEAIISLEGLLSGLYVLQIIDKNQNILEKKVLIKN
ncbi:endonuclease [Aquimarina sp. 2201CG1-2-11]|uniref:endonuclease n=1 Tax=Aquimarina discodermiae TaxID=3231043 RepID=UPI003462EBA3